MPTFIKQKAAKKIAQKAKLRRFFRRNDEATLSHLMKTPPPPKIDPPIPPIPEAEIIKESTDSLAEPETQVADIHRLIQEKSFALKEEAEEPTPLHHDIFIETPEAFDGVSSESEQLRLLEERLITENRRARKVEHEMNLLKAEFEEERKQLEHTIKELKQELHRTVPLQDNKFFSLSKELRSAMEDIAEITKNNTTTLPLSLTPAAEKITELVSDISTPVPPAQSPDQSPTQIPKSSLSDIAASVPKQVVAPLTTPPPPPKKSAHKKRALITGAVAVVIILLVSGTIGLNYLHKPTVDQALVEEYLTKQAQPTGQVAGIKTASQEPTPEADPMFANVTFEETQWDTLGEPIFGVQFMYPKNAAKLNKTESSITFLRHTGYLFKVQRVETALSLKAYWEQIRATTLNYQAEQTTFKTKPALHLTLEDATEYPGNRYLVKVDDFIYDIWYATKSAKFTDDDAKRALKMVESLTFLTVIQ